MTLAKLGQLSSPQWRSLSSFKETFTGLLLVMSFERNNKKTDCAGSLNTEPKHGKLSIGKCPFKSISSFLGHVHATLRILKPQLFGHEPMSSYVLIPRQSSVKTPSPPLTVVCSPAGFAFSHRHIPDLMAAWRSTAISPCAKKTGSKSNLTNLTTQSGGPITPDTYAHDAVYLVWPCISRQKYNDEYGLIMV